MSPLAARIRSGLAEIADPERAPAMQAYMKSAMPYLGVSSAPRRALLQDLVRGSRMGRCRCVAGRCA